MTITRENVCIAMNRFYTLFGKPKAVTDGAANPEQVVDEYQKCMGNMCIKCFDFAVAHAITHCRFFPSVSDLMAGAEVWRVYEHCTYDGKYEVVL